MPACHVNSQAALDTDGPNLVFTPGSAEGKVMVNGVNSDGEQRGGLALYITYLTKSSLALSDTTAKKASRVPAAHVTVWLRWW